jgi:CHAT domain-containing protein/tetratricopeptide (TPR) repeat protein
MTMNNLANAYHHRIRGERVENIETAVFYFQEALKVMTREAMPVVWARTMNNLGTVFSDRLRGDRAGNLENAIHYFQLALTVYTDEVFPFDWAMVQINLANAYGDRIEGNRAENLEKGIFHCQQALEVYTLEAAPERWATTQVNLATLFSDRLYGDRAENCEAAIHHYQQALVVFTNTAFPIKWARTMANLGAVYSSLVQDDNLESFQQALFHYQKALTVLTRDTLPVDYLKAQSNLGHLHFDNERWEEAFDTYSEALAAGEDMLALAYTEEGRRVEVAQTSHLYMRAAFCLVQTGQVADALIQLETGKTRLLTEALALSSVFVDSLPAAQRQTLGELQQTIRTLEAESRSVSDDTGHRHRPEHSVQLRDARTKLNNLIASIRAENPDFPPTGMTLHDILALAVPGEALVMPLFTSQGSAAFVVPHGTRTLTEEHLVRFSGFTDDHLRALLAGNKEQPGWLREYATFNATRDLRAWRLALERFTGRLWESILSQVHKRLQTLGAQRVIFMPQGGLGLLPLHAAWRLENGVRRYFIDEYIVRFAPSANALDAAQRHLALREGQRSALILGVSAYEHLNDLPNARPEAEAIADLFDTSPLVDEQATLQAVLNSAPGTAYLHLASHGAFAWGNALNSALVLAGHEKLTLADIIRKLDLDAARLVTLSACETGITDVQQSPDEYVGFPAGFMQAGAPGVVSSLWTVEDRSTALLMERFYRHHLEDNLPPAEALRAAQLWLRDLTRAELGDYYQSFYRISADQAKAEFAKVMLGGAPDDRPYASPYYWAAFTFNGV